MNLSRRVDQCIWASLALVATILVVLSLIPTHPFVTIRANVDRVEMLLLGDNDSKRSLLHEHLELRSLHWRDVMVAPWIDPGCNLPESGGSGTLTLRAESEPLFVDVALRSVSTLEIRRSGTDRIWIRFLDGRRGGDGFASEIQAVSGASLTLMGDLALPDGWCRLPRGESVAPDPDLQPVVFVAGGPRPSLRLEPWTLGGRRLRLRRIDAVAGSDYELAPDVDEIRILGTSDVVLAEQVDVPWPEILHVKQALRAGSVQFFDESGAQGLPESFVESARVTFWDGSRPPVDLPARSFLRVEPASVRGLQVQSVAMATKGLDVVVEGHVRTLSVGPDVNSERDLRPSRLEDLYAREAVRQFGLALLSAVALILAALIQGRREAERPISKREEEVAEAEDQGETR